MKVEWGIESPKAPVLHILFSFSFFYVFCRCLGEIVMDAWSFYGKREFTAAG